MFVHPQTDEAGALDTETEMKAARAEMMDLDDDGKVASSTGAAEPEELVRFCWTMILSGID